MRNIFFWMIIIDFEINIRNKQKTHILEINKKAKHIYFLK